VKAKTGYTHTVIHVHIQIHTIRLHVYLAITHALFVI